MRYGVGILYSVEFLSVQEISIGIAVAPFISFLESIAIAKAFGEE